MEICFVGIEIIPPFTGGLVNNVVRLSKGMSKKGHNVRIITSDLKNKLRNKIIKLEGFEIHPISIKGEYGSLRGNLEFILKAIPKIKKESSLKKIDILHFHSGYSIFGLIPLLIKNIIDIPIVFSLYSPIQSNSLNDRKGIYQKLSTKRFSRIILPKSGKIICTSENIKKSISGLGIKNISIVPPVVDTDIFNSSLSRNKKRNELGISKDCLVILYCGSWSKWKGVDYLIKAVYELIDEFPCIKLITAWGEPYNWYDNRKHAISNMIKKYNISENIIELGVVEDINMLMSACDVFVAPFLNIDGIADPPLSILEAMACGRPVVATKIGSVPAMFKNRNLGLVVEPGNTKELKDAIKYLLENESIRNEMGINAANYVYEMYSMESVLTRLEEIYLNEIKI